jgi:Acyl-CoA dehydrogenase, C-terminal domain
MDPAERALLEEAVVAALAGSGANADVRLAELGWLDMLAAEPRDAIAIVFHALGATNGAATVLDDVVVSALGRTPRPDLAVLYPQFSGWAPPGAAVDGYTQALGLATARVATARELLVVVGSSGSGLRAAVVPISSTAAVPLQGVDPDAGLHMVRVEHPGTEDEPIEVEVWESGLALGRRALAYAMLGASRAMLALARAHALERVQFGRPVASFQAVRHRLADALVAIEALDATLDAAADEPNQLTAALAKATAGRTVRTVATQSQQVLAGIGFTTDHPFHLYLKRTMVLEGLFGSADEIALDLGRQLLAARRVPTLIEL